MGLPTCSPPNVKGAPLGILVKRSQGHELTTACPPLQETTRALAHAWLAYISALRDVHSAQDSQLVDVSQLLLASAAHVGTHVARRPPPAADAPPPRGHEAPELGAGVAGGELPLFQATCLYILKTGVVDQCGEGG